MFDSLAVNFITRKMMMTAWIYKGTGPRITGCKVHVSLTGRLNFRFKFAVVSPAASGFAEAG